MAGVRNPVHTIFHRAILHACRRASASRAAFVDHRQNVRLALTLGRCARGFWLALDYLIRRELCNRRKCFGHSPPASALCSAGLQPGTSHKHSLLNHSCRPRVRCQSCLRINGEKVCLRLSFRFETRTPSAQRPERLLPAASQCKLLPRRVPMRLRRTIPLMAMVASLPVYSLWASLPASVD